MSYILTLIPCTVFIALVAIKKKNMLYIMGDLLLMGYLTFTLYYITEIATVSEFLAGRDGPVNLHLFDSEGLSTYVLNVLLFLPLGALLPILYKKYRNFWFTCITGFTFSACIEFLQLFNHRVTDIEDLITNTLGTILGYILFKIFEKAFDREPPKTVLAEPVVIIILSILGVFFLK